jgi:hypothetical protein
VYRFLCLFSLAGVVFLSSIARMLLTESPFFPARSKHGLSRREMGWAVVEVRDRVCEGLVAVKAI